MVNKQLADWIKSEEAQGYSEQQLRQYLTRQKYNEKDIEDAVKSVKGSERPGFYLKNYVKLVSLPIILAFLASFMFLAFSIDKVNEGAIVLVMLGASVFILDLFYERNLPRLAKFLLGLVLTILIVSISLKLEAFIMSLIVLIHTLTYYSKSKKKYNLVSVFLTLFISLTLVLALTLIAYLILAYGAFSLMGTVQALISYLIVSLIIIVFISSYLLISIKLLKRSLGEFDYGAYFRYKHFPFSILNILSSREENIKKSVIKATSILYILLLLISLIATAIVGIIWTDQIYSRQSSAQRSVSGQIIAQSYDRYGRIIRLKGYEDVNFNPIMLQHEVFLYSKSGLGDVKTIFYDCDTELNCKNKSFNPNEKLENQASLRESSMFVITDNSPRKAIFIIPRHSFEEAIAYNVFEFEDSELRDTMIALEINGGFQKVFREMVSKQVQKPQNWQEKLLYLYKGKVHGEIIDGSLLMTKSAISLDNLRMSRDTAKTEYNWVKKNRINGTEFYDGTTSAEEHIQKLQSNINQLYPQMPVPIKKEDSAAGATAIYSFFDVERGHLVEKASAKIFKHLDIYKAYEELSIQSAEIRRSFVIDKINEEYNKKDIQENEASKILRLKIIETKVASQIIRNCRTYECKKPIISLTKNPLFCKGVYYVYKDNCIIQCSEYNKEICREISDGGMMGNCLTDNPSLRRIGLSSVN
ncbi:energy-coupling factor transporter transmembrane protein EcfT [Candidatus Woesearchaeota archaeon]|nr:energy-coupling factor transporter transmembrane protein EcfT [Candidatus Woesearchaeota archaeon]